MQLHSFDDFPFHQHPAPVNNPVTTDAKYNDGHWFAFYGPSTTSSPCSGSTPT